MKATEPKYEKELTFLSRKKYFLLFYMICCTSNRIAAMVVGARNMEKALIKALLIPWHLLKEAQDSYDHTRVLACKKSTKPYLGEKCGKNILSVKEW